ncbi:hypothetical protein ABW21_db0204563 [Orbilia brochopaga]|nr:hypothetical protein ABW21_db0204563 [Drechslerella brochopaga]
MTSSSFLVRVLLLLSPLISQLLSLAAAAPTGRDPKPNGCRISGRFEKIFADFQDHPNKNNPLGTILPVGIYKGISWEGYVLGNSAVGTGGTDVFPIDAEAPYPVARYLIDELAKFPPKITITYDNSPSKLFTLHSLNFHCSTLTVIAPVPILIDCVISFTPVVNGVRRPAFEATFEPVDGTQIPGVVTPKSPQAFTEFPDTFCGITDVEVSFKLGTTSGPLLGLGGGLGVPTALASVPIDNVNYTLYYKV